MSKKRTYDDALSALTDILSDREKEIDAREEKLRKAEENFEVDRLAAYGDTKSSDVLHLNIGGTKMTVLRRTLTSIPGSMLASKFSGRWDDSLEKDKDGNFFIDQDFSTFEPILKYLRNKGNGTEKYTIEFPTHTGLEAGVSLKDVYRMIEYYGMTNGIFSTHLTIHTRSSDDSVDIIHPKKANAKKWTTLELSRKGHDRLVRSYEVTLGDNVQRIQIGWKYTDDEVVFTTNARIGSGVGEVEYTHALNLTEDTYMIAGEEEVIVTGYDNAKGTTVRSEDFGRLWYVNGELLDIPQEAQDAWKNLDLHAQNQYGVYSNRNLGISPLISLIGDIEITDIELANRVD